MSRALPAGWPRHVPPVGAPGFAERATEWLLDQCPADYRAHGVLRRHLPALAWLATRHLDAQREATLAAVRAARAELGDPVDGPLDTRALDELVDALQGEAARLLGAARAARLLSAAVRDARMCTPS